MTSFLFAGAIFAGVISDYIGGRAMICSIMLTLAAPAVSSQQT